MKLVNFLTLAILATSFVSAIEFSYDLPVKKISCFGDSLGELITVLLEVNTHNTNYQFRVYDPEGKQSFNITENVQMSQRVNNFGKCFKFLL